MGKPLLNLSHLIGLINLGFGSPLLYCIPECEPLGSYAPTKTAKISKNTALALKKG